MRKNESASAYDNGRGIPADANADHQGVGLQAMRHRIERLGRRFAGVAKL